MARFFLEKTPAIGDEVWLDEKESRHALSVLRLKSGQAIDLLDGKGFCFSAKISGSRDGLLSARIESAKPVLLASPADISVGMSVIKPERMELFIQKACELGVSKIYPLITDRSIIKLSRERWAAKLLRWEKIIQESCKQCGLPRIPEIAPVGEFEGLIPSFKDFDGVLIPTLGPKTETLGNILKSMPAKRILVLIGPEGDFTPEEVQKAVRAGAKPVSLGPLVLRSETAGIYVLSAIHFYYREV